MSPEKLTEGTNDERQAVPVDDRRKALIEMVQEDIEQDDTQENTKVNLDDFDDAPARKDADPEPAKNPPPADPEKSKTDPAPSPVNNARNSAVSRIMKPNTVLTFFNVMAGRIGKVANPKNPDCLKLDDEDKEDLGVVFADAVEEENWSRFPAKWMLLICVALILVGKIFSWNRKPEEKISKGDNSAELEALNAKIITLERNQEQNLQIIDELKKQNKFLQQLAGQEKKTGTKAPDRFVGEFDLKNPNLFTSKGAIVRPEMAGKKGFSPTGAKVGAQSQEEKQLYQQWRAYQDHIRESSPIEEAKIIDADDFVA